MRKRESPATAAGWRRLFSASEQSTGKTSKLLPAQATDLFRRLQRAATGEHRDSPEYAPLRLPQQLMAPVDLAPQRALAGRQVTGAVLEQVQPAVELG
jgi:hypothetical protein